MTRKMKDSGVEWIGMIPEEWNVGRLGAVLADRNESNNPVKTDVILSLTNDRGVILYADKGNQGNKSKDDITQYKLAYPNDIVLNSMNVVIGSVGLSPYFGAVSPVYYMLYPRKKTESSARFFNYIFQTSVFQQSLRGYGNGIMEIRMRIQMQKLKTVVLAYPSKEEQLRIADYLDAKCSLIDRVITKTQESIEDYKKLKQAKVIETVTNGIRGKRPMKDTGIDWIGSIPKDWKVCRIKNVIYPREKNVLESDDVITCFRDGQVALRRNRREEGFTISFTEHGYHGIDVGDLAIHGMDAFAGAIGCSEDRGKISPVVHVCETSGNNRFYMYYLRSIAYRNILMDFSNGIRIRSSDYRNFSRLGVFPAIVPSLDEQREIADYLDSKCAAIDTLISKKQQFIDELTAYKKSLIYEFVTGKKEVPA